MKSFDRRTIRGMVDRLDGILSDVPRAQRREGRGGGLSRKSE